MGLYSYVPTSGENTPVSVEPFPVDDLVPTEDEIEWVVKRLQNHRSGGTSGMRTKHLKGWLAAARNKEREEAVAKQENTTEEMTTERPDGTGGQRRVGRRCLRRLPIGRGWWILFIRRLGMGGLWRSPHGRRWY